MRGWILGNTKIGPVLDVKVCFHQGHYGIVVMIQSLFRDRTVSWVRIVNGTDKYVTETSETSSLESVKHSVTGKLGAKARPQTTLAVTLSPISIPVRERNWIDINPERFREDCFTVSKSSVRDITSPESARHRTLQRKATTCSPRTRGIGRCLTLTHSNLSQLDCDMHFCEIGFSWSATPAKLETGWRKSPIMTCCCQVADP